MSDTTIDHPPHDAPYDDPRRPRVTHRTRVLAGGLVAGAALAVGLPGAAYAHVGASSDTTAAGAYALITLSVPHGCEGSPTTRIELAVPEGINEVVPTVDAGWEVTKTTERLAEPITLDDGDVLTERTSGVVWVARTPLPDGFRAGLSLSLQLPEDAAGRRLDFPVVQTCVEGSADWTQVAGDGVDPHELEHPAPSITVTDAEESADHHGASGGQVVAHDAVDTLTVAASSPGATRAAGGAGDSGGLGVVGLVSGLLGLAAGTLALARTRRVRPRTQD